MSRGECNSFSGCSSLILSKLSEGGAWPEDCRGTVSLREFSSSAPLLKRGSCKYDFLSWVPRCPLAAASTISPGLGPRPLSPWNRPRAIWITCPPVSGRGQEHFEAQGETLLIYSPRMPWLLLLNLYRFQHCFLVMSHMLLCFLHVVCELLEESYSMLEGVIMSQGYQSLSCLFIYQAHVNPPWALRVTCVNPIEAKTGLNVHRFC